MNNNEKWKMIINEIMKIIIIIIKNENNEIMKNNINENNMK